MSYQAIPHIYPTTENPLIDLFSIFIFVSEIDGKYFTFLDKIENKLIA